VRARGRRRGRRALLRARKKALVSARGSVFFYCGGSARADARCCRAAALHAGIEEALARRLAAAGAAAVAAAAAGASPTAAARKARADAAAEDAARCDADAAAACEHANEKARTARRICAPAAPFSLIRISLFASARALSLSGCCRLQCALAKECYDLVDSHIRRLDRDLAACDEEAARAAAAAEAAAPDAAAAHAAAHAHAGAPKHAKSHAKRSAKGTHAQHSRGRIRTSAHVRSLLLLTSARPVHARPSPGGGLPPGALAAAGGMLGAGGLLARGAELPVDPNEPTYCSCQRVSFGDMVACESDACPIEWFHYECVGKSLIKLLRFA
jgi:hypothetical protein